MEYEISGLMGYKQKCEDMENKIALLSSEIQNLHQAKKRGNDEIEEWKNRYSKLELQLSNMRIQEQRLTEYENRIALLSQEIERLNGLIR